jgi:DNA-binding transcriptional MocR family regulator
MSRDALKQERERALAQYDPYVQTKRTVNMARGKPGVQQVALSYAMLGNLTPEDCTAEDGTDALNYGGNEGLPEMKRLFAQMLDVAPQDVIVGGNSSLQIMYDCVTTFIQPHQGYKFLCPAPGYDRHFAVCEYFGIEMLTVPMTPSGPDMDTAARLAAQDPAVAGMWCVPVFSNPQGYVYSRETVTRLASMPTANPQFKLFWDDAYTVHHFRGDRPRLPHIMRECESAGHPDRPLMFASFSKISIAGMGVAAVAGSPGNLAAIRKRVNVQTVGPDKVNQLRHVCFFKDLQGVTAHMQAHAKLLRPKFELAERILDERLSPTGAGSFYIPDGGYFFALDTLPGCAKRVAALCKDAGIILTDAGATYPYGRDPNDQNLRIAPSFLTLEEMEYAMNVLCIAVKLAALEKMLGECAC